MAEVQTGQLEKEAPARARGSMAGAAEGGVPVLAAVERRATGHGQAVQRALAARRTSLVASTEDLAIGKARAPGRPLLLVDGCLEPVVSMWLVQRSVPSLDTGWTCAEAIDLWIRSLLEKGLDWREAQASDLEEWMECQPEGSRRHRAILVGGFYRWARVRRHIDVLPFRVVGNRFSREEAHDTLGGLPVELPPKSRDQLQVLSAEQFDAVLAASDRVDPGLRLRDELMPELGRWVGLRRMQVAHLEVAQFDQIDPLARVHAIDLVPSGTKRKKRVAVLVPRQLVNRIKRYIDWFRSRTVSAASKADPSYSEPRQLFLCQDGRPLKREYVNSIWRDAAKKAGVNARFHANRHSFATMMATEAIARGLDALLMLRAQMGHESIVTTLKYIHLSESQAAIYAAALIVNDVYDRQEVGG